MQHRPSNSSSFTNLYRHGALPSVHQAGPALRRSSSTLKAHAPAALSFRPAGPVLPRPAAGTDPRQEIGLAAIPLLRRRTSFRGLRSALAFGPDSDLRPHPEWATPGSRLHLE